MPAPTVSGYTLFEGRELIKFSGPELDRLRQRRVGPEVHLLLPRGRKKFCGVIFKAFQKKKKSLFLADQKRKKKKSQGFCYTAT